MFTGLIVETGTLEDLRTLSGITRLSIKTSSLHREAAIGDSIAVNGVCLTVVDRARDRLTFELSGETLRSTSLGSLKKGDRLNLEPSLRPDSRMGGHFVTGHVDGTGRLLSKKRVGETIELEIAAPDTILEYLVDKGSVAVDGISLTVVKALRNSFLLVIIPHTETITNLKDKREGDTVNIETDIIGKYVKKFMAGSRQDSLMSALESGGFIKKS